MSLMSLAMPFFFLFFRNPKAPAGLSHFRGKERRLRECEILCKKNVTITLFGVIGAKPEHIFFILVFISFFINYYPVKIKVKILKSLYWKPFIYL